MFNDRFSARANGLAGWWAGLGLVVLLGGCANVGQQDPLPDTVASGNAAAGSQAASATAASGATAAQPATDAAAQPAGPVTKVVTKTVWYRVRRGDTLARIAQKHGCSVKDLQAWNRLKPSSRLRNGQSLKIVSKQTVTVTASEPGAAQSSSESASETREVKAGVARHANSVQLAWPAQGHVIEPFQPGETRGIEIAGKEGDPVLAAADGRVMYAGTGLNEYGSLIIVQHNKDFLTAYSHNRRLLVKTGDVVRQGQQIAEMGSENNSRVAVLFELRRDGKPIDPMPYLPQPNG
ncbi:murein DD-endopeptidase MepM/ murein hydrolase activator NlpD [Paraburkholderia caballeronis]|uniref:peptidoglycan DD-metalloendopeptidase family protein n=1 Tax=Paraburkholderia caballeronis TaxID=416943 RepID=UPI001066082D|nr:peptidoglycan DD-metalloendopeptidase family protein [Paraburkholderia caballeronis]TDV26697.1 murein DD-endopeptidase MepM/ murein hydrolase activator NlpD [Paraburkholderia caballeronis]